MKKIVITVTLKNEIQPKERKHVLKAVVDFLYSVTLKDTLEDTIDCATCQGNLAIRRITVDLKK